MSSAPADDFYRRAGIVRHVGATEFWQDLLLACGHDVAGEIEELMRRRVHGEVSAADIEVFTADVVRQRITLDAAAPHTWTWLNTLAGVSDVHAALDLGCGGGVVACFLAMAHPSARVVGVDANATAIETAKALADELSLKNVEFFLADLVDLHLGETFDLVVSSAVWAETEHWVHAEKWWSSINQLPLLLGDSGITSVLAQTAATHLATDGVFLSLERCRDLAGLGAWIGAQQAVGLNFDATISDMLTIDGVLTGPERLPFVAAHRGALPAGVNDLVQWRLRVGDVRLDEALMAEMVMAGGSAWNLLHGQIFEASENGDDFSAALLLLERGDEGKLYFSTTRGVREVLASSPDGGAEQFLPLYRQMRDHLAQRETVVRSRDVKVDELARIIPRLTER